MDGTEMDKTINRSRSIKAAAIILIVSGILIFIASANCQTIQELDTRLKRVEDSLGIGQVITPIDTTVSLPIYQGIILNGNYDIYPSPYSPMYKDTDGYYKMFIQKAGQPYAVGSVNGMNNWIYSSAGNMPRGTVLKVASNTWAVIYHKWFNGQSYYYSAKSTNAYQWYDTYLDRSPHGEDVTYIKEGNLYRIYGRVSIPPAVRTIGYMEAYNNLTNFSPMVEVLKPDISDGDDEFYSMSVISTERGYFGFLNVFNPLSDEMDAQLVYSANGKNNWVRLLNRAPVLVKRPGVKQLYGIASIIGNEVYVIAITADFGHSETDRQGRYYYTTLYKLFLDDILSLAPQ